VYDSVRSEPWAALKLNTPGSSYDKTGSIAGSDGSSASSVASKSDPCKMRVLLHLAQVNSVSPGMERLCG
jgi:hypothetical protein